MSVVRECEGGVGAAAPVVTPTRAWAVRVPTAIWHFRRLDWALMKIPTAASVCAPGLAVLLSLATAPGCRTPESAQASPRIARVHAFRAALATDDVAAAHAMLGPDPRLWYDAQEGAGSPWRPGVGGGRWEAWDEHFRGETERATDWHEERDRVWADMREVNDYYRLTERGAGFWRATYFFDEAGDIRGFMVSAAEDAPAPAGRRDEFEAWAVANHPEEAEYLMPQGSLDPTGDRAPRMRALLNEWRSAVGLTPIH